VCRAVADAEIGRGAVVEACGRAELSVADATCRDANRRDAAFVAGRAAGLSDRIADDARV
jgi:hypothetical protein